MNKNVKAFMMSQGLTERDIEDRGNFTFLKVELMLLNALKQGQTLPIDSVVVSKAELCDCNNPVDPNYDPCCSYKCWSKKFD